MISSRITRHSIPQQHGPNIFTVVEQDNEKSVTLSDAEIEQAMEEEYQVKKQAALISVKQDGLALRCLNKRLKNDRDVVLAAVKQVPWAFEHCSEELKNDVSLVLAIIKDNAWLIGYAGKQVRSNKRIGLRALETDGSVFEYLSSELKRDADIVACAMKGFGGWRGKLVEKDLFSNNEFMIRMIAEYEEAIYHLDKTIEHDKDVMRAVYNRCRKENKWIKYYSKEYIIQNSLMFLGFEFARTRTPSRLSCEYGVVYRDLVIVVW
jgi:hypothetical protein